MAETREETEDFIDRAPMRVDVAIELPFAPAAVFDALADTQRWPEWFSTISRAEWTSATHGGVGSTRFVTIGPARVDERFIAWTPGRKWGFTFTATKPTFAAAGVELATLTELADGGTSLHYTMAIEPKGLGRVLLAYRRPTRHGLTKGLRGLETFLAQQR